MLDWPLECLKRLTLHHDGSAKEVVATLVGNLASSRANADADLTALMADATDPYATLRSVYLQNKQSQVDDANPNATPALPDFDEGGVAPATAPASPPARPATPVSDSSVPLSAG